MKAVVPCKPWQLSSPPKKILIMRFQALGDTIITLPYLQSIKRQYPKIELHFLTRDEVSSIPKNILLFNKVITIGGGRNAKIQFILSLLKLPRLWLQRYDAVIDLQNHKISRIIRQLLRTKAWTEFDRDSPISAGERTRQTIESLFSWKIVLDTTFIIQKATDVRKLLTDNGWKSNHDLIVLNPAGYSPARNWPLQNYSEFARLWLVNKPKTQFVLLLIPEQKQRSDFLSQAIGNWCIDLTGKANQVEAFSIIKMSRLVLSEDSGLMHMAWVQGVPTLAMFSSSRKDWSTPEGEWSYCFDSSDMECGPCGLEICKFGDNRCLTRYSPDFIMDKSQQLLSVTNSKIHNVRSI